MNSLLLNASRAFEALKSLLALVGVAALAAIPHPAAERPAAARRRCRRSLPAAEAQRGRRRVAAGRPAVGDPARARAARGRRIHRQALPHRRCRGRRTSSPIAYRAGDAAPRRRAADPRGDGDRVALQPGGRERHGRQGPDAGDPQVPPGEAVRRTAASRRCSSPRSTSMVGAQILREYHAPLRRRRDRAADVRRRAGRADLAVRQQGARGEGAPRRATVQGAAEIAQSV